MMQLKRAAQMPRLDFRPHPDQATVSRACRSLLMKVLVELDGGDAPEKPEEGERCRPEGSRSES